MATASGSEPVAPAQAVDEIVRKYDAEARFRTLSGLPAAVVAVVGTGLSLFQLYTAGTISNNRDKDPK